ncbi:penicillin acylase family protein, partial [Burkholderia oklahomensis]
MTSRTNRLRRWLKILPGLIILGALLVAAGAALFLRASLPQLDGDVRAPALGGPMTIERDAAGVPTVAARDRFDAAYGIGYLHAQDRFFQMDYLRRAGAGELAALLGPAALDFDREHRLFRFRARAAAALAQLPPDEQRLLRRYAQGVNDGLAALRARPFEYALIGERPARWRPEDSLLVIWAMYFQVQGTLASRDIARNWLTEHATSQQAAFLLPSSSGFDAPLDASRIDEKPAPLPGAAPDWFGAAGDGATKRASLDFRSSVGSNNWAIAGSRSARGAAIVGDDMHLVLGLPNTWYRAAFTYPAGAAPVRRAVGVTLAGLPAIVAGSNGHVAWGFTVGYADCLDLVPLERDGDDPLAFRMGGARQVARRYVESIRVRGGAPVALTVLETTAGPVREIGGRLYAVHWVAQSPGAVNLGLARLADAVDVDGAIRAANTLGIPAENIVVGDRAGQIGWTIAGALPDRRTPRDGDGGSDGPAWQSLLPPEAYPRVVDPSGGQLWTANNRQLAGDAYRLIGDGGTDLGARATQLRDGLTALGRTDERTAYRLDLDDRALFIAQWRDRALRVLDDAALAGHPSRAEFRRLLANGWTGRASVDSVGYTLARGFLYRLYDVTFDGLDARLKQVDAGADYELANPRWPAVVAR